MSSDGNKKTTSHRDVRATPLDDDGELWVLSMPEPGASADAAVGVLSSAESEVARLAARGLSNRAIAELRETSERTVANQLRSVYGKLDLHSRGELAAWYAALSR